MMQVDSKKCTGCGQCLDVCPVGAISLVKGRAVIDPEICIACDACRHACPRAAISETRSPVMAITSRIQPDSIETIEPNPDSRPISRLAWAMPVISFVGKEILPRLADSFLDSLDRRFATSTKEMSRLNVETTRLERGQGRQARRRRRGRIG